MVRTPLFFTTVLLLFIGGPSIDDAAHVGWNQVGESHSVTGVILLVWTYQKHCSPLGFPTALDLALLQEDTTDQAHSTKSSAASSCGEVDCVKGRLLAFLILDHS